MSLNGIIDIINWVKLRYTNPSLNIILFFVYVWFLLVILWIKNYSDWLCPPCETELCPAVVCSNLRLIFKLELILPFLTSIIWIFILGLLLDYRNLLALLLIQIFSIEFVHLVNFMNIEYPLTGLMIIMISTFGILGLLTYLIRKKGINNSIVKLLILLLLYTPVNFYYEIADIKTLIYYIFVR